MKAISDDANVSWNKNQVNGMKLGLLIDRSLDWSNPDWAYDATVDRLYSIMLQYLADLIKFQREFGRAA